MGIFYQIRQLITKLVASSKKSNQPAIIPRSEHIISRKNISREVLKVLYTLKENSYQAYLVGGGVRDLLLNQVPKDFDVATDAYPEKIKKIFKHSYIIGKRFQLVHVYMAREVIEVATFRAKHNGKHSKEGMILRDNVYGNIEQDALRRDFTINALYYNICDYTVVDYVGGLQDLENSSIRLIGNPVTRYREDPVRMLRAIRFAAKLNFSISATTEQPLYELGHLLLNVSPSRLYDEVIKLFFNADPVKSYELLQHYGLFNILFPSVKLLKNLKHAENMMVKGLGPDWFPTKERPEEAAAYLIAIILWYNLLELKDTYLQAEDVAEFVAYKKAGEKLLCQQNKIISLSKRLRLSIKDLWLLQLKITKICGKPGKRADKLINANKFAQAMQFLRLRASSIDPQARKVSRWWNKYLATKGNSN